MKFRHELKHEINLSDMLVLRARLSHVMQRDAHGKDGGYFIRSLYFDDIYDTALYDKINGVNKREKFRIRYYDFDTSCIKLEKKSKINGLCSKASVRLSVDEADRIARGDIAWMKDCDRELVRELYSRMCCGLAPKVVVDYKREAFVFFAGNVRVTLDSDIRTGLRCRDFLNPDIVTVPVAHNPIILEVKWDEFLPDIIRSAVTLDGRRSAAFSKYAACRF